MSGYEKGSYLGEVLDHGFEEIGAKKTPALKVDFRVIAEKKDGEYVETEDRYVRGLTIWFTDKTAERAIANIRKYAGWEGEDIGELNDGVLVGNQIEVVCEGQDDGGYDRFDFPFEGGSKKPPQKNSKVAKALRNKFNKLAKLNGKPSVAVKTKPPVEDDDDDDVPF